MYAMQANELIDKAAEELKKIDELKPPVWAGFVKTGVHKERPPTRLDWWYVRAAAVLRTIYRMGPIGVQKLRTKYGGRHRRGHKQPKFAKASGNILRKILQQLEKARLVKKGEAGIHKGRVITAQGKKLLDEIGKAAVKVKPEVKKEEPKKEEITKEKPKKPLPEPETRKEPSSFVSQKSSISEKKETKEEPPKPEPKKEETLPEPKPEEKKEQ